MNLAKKNVKGEKFVTVYLPTLWLSYVDVPSN